jgi:hypothetical protein
MFGPGEADVVESTNVIGFDWGLRMDLPGSEEMNRDSKCSSWER